MQPPAILWLLKTPPPKDGEIIGYFFARMSAASMAAQIRPVFGQQNTAEPSRTAAIVEPVNRWQKVNWFIFWVEYSKTFVIPF